MLTPPGRGAVATVRVVGEGSAKIVGQCFVAGDGRRREDFPLGRVLYGRWGSPAGEEVVVCRRPVTWASLSETRGRVSEKRGHVEAAAIEIHCHGGSAAAQAIVQSLVERGVETVPVRELPSAEIDHLQTLRDPPSAPGIAREARNALALAPTLRTANILLEQWAGALANEAGQIVQLLSSEKTADAVRRVEGMLRWSSLGLHLATPWRVVLAGRPNVGKSSLINALLGYERSIVFDQPGTTRDVVTATAALDGWPVELTDTAGLRIADDRSSTDALEVAGMAKALEQIAAADLLVLVFDAALPWSEEDEELVRSHPRAVRVLNKCDLVVQAARLADLPLTPTLSPEGRGGDETGSSFGDGPLLRTSAITGEGIASLGRHIAARLVPDVPAAGAAVPFTQQHVELLIQALAAARLGEVGAAREFLTRLLKD